MRERVHPMVTPTLPRPTIYTIGHSNHDLSAFVALLRRHGIEVLVDVRSQPYSGYTPHFSRESLEAAIVAAGFKYLFMGKELGGRPDGAGFYNADGRVNYSVVERSEPFKQGLARLEQGLRRYRVAMLCSEEDPHGCHRRRLVGRVLANERGIALLHIRGDGRVEREESVRHDDERDDGQLPLFAELSEVEKEWTSIRPVLPRDRRPASSEP